MYATWVDIYHTSTIHFKGFTFLVYICKQFGTRSVQEYGSEMIHYACLNISKYYTKYVCVIYTVHPMDVGIYIWQFTDSIYKWQMCMGELYIHSIKGDVWQ